MVKVPSFLLKKLYVKGSLKNTDDGFQFELQNTLADATIVEPVKIAIDDMPIDPEKITLISGEREVKSTEISLNNTIPLKVNTKVTVKIKGKKLDEGGHKITIETKSKEYGTLSFDVKDVLE
jgi:hydroxymethylglutaryl-CoA reductase (NADPH)